MASDRPGLQLAAGQGLPRVWIERECRNLQSPRTPANTQRLTCPLSSRRSLHVSSTIGGGIHLGHWCLDRPLEICLGIGIPAAG